jgi:hypothetical protein
VVLLAAVPIALLAFDGQLFFRLPLHVFLVESFAIPLVDGSLGSGSDFDVGAEGALFGLFGLNGPPAFLEESLPFLPQRFVLPKERSTSL